MSDINSETGTKQKYEQKLVKNFIAILFASVFAYKIIIFPFTVQLDFVALLSLLLALFSIGLSALFYFKATETSNQFYDNTFKYTKDIAQLLVKIESEFGEKLKHLDEGYTNMRDLLQYTKKDTKTDIKEANEELKEEENVLEEKLKERNKLIEELAVKANLQEKEKSDFIDKLDQKDNELSSARREIHFLRKKLEQAKAGTNDLSIDLPNILIKYIQDHFLKSYNRDFIITTPSARLNEEFKKFTETLPDKTKYMLLRHNIVDEEGDLTPVGIKLMRGLAAI